MSQVIIIKKLKYIRVSAQTKPYCILYDVDFDSNSYLYANMYNHTYYVPLKIYESIYNALTWMKQLKGV